MRTIPEPPDRMRTTGSILTHKLRFTLLSISNVQSSLEGDVKLSGLTFRFVGTDAANGSASKGTLTIDSTDYLWQDANGGPTQMTFPGHIHGTTSYAGFNTDKDGQTLGSISVKSGFDLPATSGGLVEAFSHHTTAGSYRLNDLVVEVEVTEVVRADWNFDDNDNSDLSSISQTVSALDGTVSFDFNVTMASAQGTVVDTSSITGPANQRRGIGVNAFSNMDLGEEIEFEVSITSISGGAAFSGLTFRFIGVEAGNGNTSAGQLTVDASDYVWQDANGNGVTNNAANTGSDFSGHLPGVTQYSAGPGSYITVQSGFDLPTTSGGSVESFSHLTTAGSYRLNDLVVEVEVTTD